MVVKAVKVIWWHLLRLWNNSFQCRFMINVKTQTLASCEHICRAHILFKWQHLLGVLWLDWLDWYILKLGGEYDEYIDFHAVQLQLGITLYHMPDCSQPTLMTLWVSNWHGSWSEHKPKSYKWIRLASAGIVSLLMGVESTYSVLVCTIDHHTRLMPVIKSNGTGWASNNMTTATSYKNLKDTGSIGHTQSPWHE